MSELDHTADSGRPRSDGELAPGAQLGKYKLDRVLGAGGMGVVWQAHDPDLDRAVAIKVLRGVDAGPMLRARLLREARAMARLKHPNVLTVYEVGTDGDRDYIAIELVEGTNLDAWLAVKPPQPEVIEAILAAGRGLAAAHAAGLVHRDFKPHNVLRSRDGRVLVTDFGLARGTASEDAARDIVEPATLPTVAGGAALADTLDATPPRTTGLLDSTLTQTGALIGTPAYMAPEQFVGAAPDPRTDQFAFCVTAWQALAGERPFRGQNFDQLRRAIADGVEGLPAKMPRGVRAVLARGLAVDPAARWPDLESLLAALERALRPRRANRTQLAFAAFGVLAAIFLYFRIARSSHETPAPPPPSRSLVTCSSPEAAFEDAWFPAHGAAIVKRVGADQAQDIVHALDETRADWLRAYAGACGAPAGTVTLAQLTCLLGERDQITMISRLLDTIPKDSLVADDLARELPLVSACEGPTPVAPPLMPEDRRLRDRLVSLRVQIATLRFGNPFDFDGHVSQLVSAARAIGWKPLEAEIYAAQGEAAEMAGSYDDAFAAYEHAIDIAEQQHDVRLVAKARIALFEIESEASHQPGERDRADRVEQAARLAVERAGGDAVLGLRIDRLVAHDLIERRHISEGVDRAQRVREGLLAARDYYGAMEAAHDEMDGYLIRGEPGDLDEAAQVGHDMIAAFDAAGRRGLDVMIDLSRADVARERGDLAEAHALLDKYPGLRVKLPGARAITGKVVTSNGAPAAGARVVAWSAYLGGDATRADATSFGGAVTTTDASGEFHLDAVPHGAVVAELGDTRSAPVAAGDQQVVLKLGPTRVVRGHVRVDPDDAAGLQVVARLDVQGNTWRIATPVARDGAYELGGVVRGATLALDRDGHTVKLRDGADASWPPGAPVDVIVRGSRREELVVLLRGAHEVHTRGQLDALLGAAAESCEKSAQPVGFASQTDLGFQEGYQAGDLHAVCRDFPPGELTACTASTAVTCASATLTDKGLAIVLKPKHSPDDEPRENGRPMVIH